MNNKYTKEYVENLYYVDFVDKYVSLLGSDESVLKFEAANSLQQYLNSNDSSHLENFYVLPKKENKKEEMVFLKEVSYKNKP